jgi:chemotaxis protein CheX
MDAAYVNPFLTSVGHVFRTLLKIEPQRKAIRLATRESPGELITATIGIAGEMQGVVALGFPLETATQIACKLLGQPADKVGELVGSAVSELVNMVAGAAKAKFDCDPPLTLGLPMVVRGTNYKLEYPEDATWLEVPFESEVGVFSLKVTMSAKMVGAA